MRGLTLFAPKDIQDILQRYMLGKTTTAEQVCAELNAKLCEMAEYERDLEEHRRPIRPNCF